MPMPTIPAIPAIPAILAILVRHSFPVGGLSTYVGINYHMQYWHRGFYCS